MDESNESPTRSDPITREVVRNALVSIADSMSVTIMRTARSQVVRDAMDCAAGIFCPHGESVAQGLTHPVAWGMMQPALEQVIRTFPEKVNEADVFLLNDPYLGGAHLPDIMLFKPVFSNSILIGWVGTEAHHADIGGRVAGGIAADNSDIFQDGLQFPPLKLYDSGVLNGPVWQIIERNVRVPEKVMGDLAGQIAALRTGEQDLIRLAEEYGADALLSFMEDLLDTAEYRMRAELSAIPDGQWEFTDHLDEDGLDPDPIAIKVTVTKSGDSLEVDFTGTSPQGRGSINSDFTTTTSFVRCVLSSVILAGDSANGGTFRPIVIRAPVGCFINSRRPGAVSARGLSAQRAGSALLGALAQPLPHRVPADWGGGSPGVTFAGVDESGQQFVFTDFVQGTRGGGPDSDADDGIVVPIINTANVPIEKLEAEEPLLIERYGLVPDTGGPGTFRGSLATLIEYRVLVDAVLRVRSDRRKFLPWGLRGGKPGMPLQNTLNPDGENVSLPGIFERHLAKGDVYRLVLASGGGFGDPLERDPQAVLADVRQEKITTAHARQEYGVILNDAGESVDADATAARRQRLRGSEASPN